MDNTTDQIATSAANMVVSPLTTDVRMSELSSLLTSLDESAHSDVLPGTTASEAHQARIVQKRLGLASSLFLALRAKHPPTAEHSFRMAEGESWVAELALEPSVGSAEPKA